MVGKHYFDIGFCKCSKYFIQVLSTVTEALYTLKLSKTYLRLTMLWPNFAWIVWSSQIHNPCLCVPYCINWLWIIFNFVWVDAKSKLPTNCKIFLKIVGYVDESVMISCLAVYEFYRMHKSIGMLLQNLAINTFSALGCFLHFYSF